MLCVSVHTSCAYKASMCVCCLWFDGLTDDDSGDLVPAGPVLILDLADESGVDGVVHLPHCQLVAIHHHIVWQSTGCPGEKEAEEKERKERGMERGS